MTLKGRNSCMWRKHFVLNASKKVGECIYCGQRISLKCGQSGNLMRHIRLRHPQYLSGCGLVTAENLPILKNDNSDDEEVKNDGETSQNNLESDEQIKVAYEIPIENLIQHQNGEDAAKHKKEKKKTKNDDMEIDLSDFLTIKKKEKCTSSSYASAYGEYVGKMIEMFSVRKGTMLIGQLNNVITNFVLENSEEQKQSSENTASQTNEITDTTEITTETPDEVL